MDLPDIDDDDILREFKKKEKPVEVDEINFSAREYQDELLSIAIKENTILYLPTGSGKTFIATMLIKHFSPFIEKQFSKGGQRAFFLVNTVALVVQQAASLTRHTNFNVGNYSGDMNVDLWAKRRWLDELEDNSVIVMTAQILLNMLQHDYIKITDIKVIVFDECHNAVRDHPMRNIMKFFENVPPEDSPRVLGLTGSLLNGTIRVNEVSSYIREVEQTFLARIITATSDDMATQIDSFSTDPQEMILYYDMEDVKDIAFHDTCRQDFQSLKQFIMLLSLDEEFEAPAKPNFYSVRMVDGCKLNKKLCNMMEDIMFQLSDLGTYGGYIALLAHMIQLERLKKSANNNIVSAVFQTMITKFTELRRTMDKVLSKYDETERISKHATNKVIQLIELLKTVKKDDTVLVFAERRFTCKVLYYIISDFAKAGYLQHIVCDFIVGYNNNPFNDTREGVFEKKVNKNVLLKFNTNVTNVLIASDVLEEGIDVQSCNLVIKFNKPKTARSYIQSKGRARNRTSRYIIMVDKKDDKFVKIYQQYRQLQNAMKEELVGKFLYRKPPSKEELDQTIFNHTIPPFFPSGPQGPMLSANGAISLLNRYCTTLYVDFFTKAAPFWWKNEEDSNIVVTLQLPNASSIRETIVGDPYPNLELAKRSAALKACMVLYQHSELDDNLLPRGRSSVEFEDKEMFPNWTEETPKMEDGESQRYSGDPGTKRRKQLYLKKV